jgi:hypothetical protein
MKKRIQFLNYRFRVNISEGLCRPDDLEGEVRVLVVDLEGLILDVGDLEVVGSDANVAQSTRRRQTVASQETVLTSDTYEQTENAIFKLHFTGIKRNTTVTINEIVAIILLLFLKTLQPQLTNNFLDLDLFINRTTNIKLLTIVFSYTFLIQIYS